MRTIAECVEDIKSILNNVERTQEYTGETSVDINELVDEILSINAVHENQATCLIETEQKRIIKELNGMKEYVVSERNGFKRTYIEKERALHIVENMPFL